MIVLQVDLVEIVLNAGLEFSHLGAGARLAVNALGVETVHLNGVDQPLYDNGDFVVAGCQSEERHAEELALAVLRRVVLSTVLPGFLVALLMAS